MLFRSATLGQWNGLASDGSMEPHGSSILALKKTITDPIEDARLMVMMQWLIYFFPLVMIVTWVVGAQ